MLHGAFLDCVRNRLDHCWSANDPLLHMKDDKRDVWGSHQVLMVSWTVAD
jgi:hypothetical protein